MSMLLRSENRTKLYAAIMIVALSFGVIFALTQTMSLDGNYIGDIGGNAQCSYGYELQGIDEDGNIFDIPVDANPLQSAFNIDGDAAETLLAGVSWSAVGDGVDWNTFSLDGEIKISVISAFGGDDNTDSTSGIEYTMEKTIFFTSVNVDDSFSEILVLGTDIAFNSDYKVWGYEIGDPTQDIPSYMGEGWYYKFEYSITARVTDVLGDTIVESENLGSFGLWIEYGVEFILTGTVL